MSFYLSTLRLLYSNPGVQGTTAGGVTADPVFSGLLFEKKTKKFKHKSMRNSKTSKTIDNEIPKKRDKAPPNAVIKLG
jgi:hypothetical protein